MTAKIKTIVTNNTEIAVRENQQVEVLIAQAIEKGTPVETMERLLAMRKELKAEFAKEQFDKAMANFQGECPVIKKEKAGGQTNAGVVAYYYAPLEQIVTQTKDLIKENGFSYAIQTHTITTGVKVTCIVKHIAGHSESSDVEVPLGTKTNVMSQPQVVASALTFAKRYAFCNAFGILTGDNDNMDDKSHEDENKKSKGLEKIKIIISKFKLEECAEYMGKIAKSEKYNDEQKAELKKLAEDRVAEIKAEKK